MSADPLNHCAESSAQRIPELRNFRVFLHSLAIFRTRLQSGVYKRKML
jgi:hypothetical protein